MTMKLCSAMWLLTLFTLLFLPNSFAQAVLSNPSVRLIYFLPNDRPARPERITALQELIKEAQQFYADEMARHGFGRKTFNVETDKDGEPVVHRIDGKFTENYYYEGLSDYKIWEESFEHFDDLRHVYFIAIDISHETLNEGDSCGLGGAAFIPSGGNASFSFNSGAIRHRDTTTGEEALGGSVIIPASGYCFEDDVYLQNHKFRVTRHELGHAFGLEHDFRNGVWDNDTVMGGRGFELSHCGAEWLSVSRFFNSGPVSGNSPGDIKLLSAPIHTPEGIKLRFRVTDVDGLHQAQLLAPENLEDGSRGPFRLFDCKQLNGRTSTVEIISTALTIDPVDRVTLQIIDVGGSITWATFLVDIASVLPPPKVVSIPDRNLAAAVRAQLGLAPRDAITDQVMQRLTRLSAEDRRISNLKGLEYATQLAGMDLGRNQIKNYNPLAQLPKLTKLYLWGNNISDLSVLPPMPQLEFLDLNWNEISDLSPLAEFTSLKELWFQGNKLADTSTLFQLHSGTFPPDEEVEVVKERDRGNRAYTLLLFRSLDLKVRINPDVVISRSANSFQETQQPLTPIDVLVESSVHPLMCWVNTETGTLHCLVDAEVENLAPGVRNATSLAIDVAGGKLYWAERTSDRTGKIRRANLDGTGVRLVRDLTSVPHDIALDAAGGKIYLTNSWGKVQRLNVDGSDFQPNLITGLDAPRGLALDVSGGKVYWTEMAGRIRRANLNGSNIEDIATGLGTPMDLVVFDGTVYWTEKTGENRGEIRFVTSDRNRNVVTRNTFPQDFPVGIALDAVDGKLYWATSRGIIGRQALDGGDSQPNFVTGLGAPGAFAVSVEPKEDIETRVVPVIDAVLSISPSPAASPAIGELLTLNLNIAAGEAVAGYQVTIQFDATTLRYVESSNGDYLPDGAFFVPPVVNRGRLELASTALGGVSNGDGTLATITFEVLAVKVSTLILSEPLLSDDQGNTFRPRVEPGKVTEPPKLKGDVNGDSVVNVQDLVLVGLSFGKTGQDAADINGDGVVNIGDLVLVAGNLGTAAGAPTLLPNALGLLTAADVRDWLSQAHQLDSSSADYQRGLLVLEQLFGALMPKETRLLANYPNPFNPETWIPYQLAKSGDVKITIYDARGTVVRRLAFGHQSAGYYTDRNRAAYWDGRNTLGEHVASGIYFYQLEANGVSLLRKMVTLK